MRENRQIDASQAVAFVRQRRDLYERYNFTDLDRERRQQAFISSLAVQLKQAGTLANPVKLQQIIDVTKQNTAIDSGLNLLSFAQDAERMAGGNVTFYTLPIKSFGKTPQGEDINVVDVAEIQAHGEAAAHARGGSGPRRRRPAARRGRTDEHRRSSSAGHRIHDADAQRADDRGRHGTPAPTDLTAISGGGIPCVK